ncbi:MAG TPA: hypothetical protein EYN66_09505, partial [Myxococcales bacterium]|nr:hypothetical protein [Myxococcales bacterium]
MKLNFKYVVLGCVSLFLLVSCGDDQNGEVTSCKSHADCVSLDSDADHCNGGFSCQVGVCVAQGEAAVCETTGCITQVCVQESGQCAEGSPVEDGTSCEQDSCLVEQICVAGECQGGIIKCSEDDNPCTQAWCNPNNGSCGNKAKDDLEACDDGNPCTSGDICLSGDCSGVAKACNVDSGTCVSAACDIASGECVESHLDDGSSCDDGDPCSLNEQCESGSCNSGEAKCAPSTNPCQAVACDADTGECVETPMPDGSECSDGDACTLSDECVAGACAGTPVVCDASENSCAEKLCEPSSGECSLVALAGTPLCDDGNGCTENDQCFGGLCVGTQILCEDDGNACTIVQCINDNCVGLPKQEFEPCDDGDPCTADGFCESSVCKAGAEKCPQDSNSCTLTLCDPISGACSIGLLADGSSCDTQNPCVLESECKDGSCSGGQAINCADDGDPCTVSFCIPQEGGCVTVNAPEGSVCEDGDLCTSGEICTSGTCVGGTTKTCTNNGNSCLVSGCDSTVGCTNTPVSNGQECDDGDACTQNDSCQLGNCEGEAAECLPASPCMTAQCHIELGCVQIAMEDGLPCDDSSQCTSDSTCSAGDCVAKSVVQCADPEPGDPCVVGVCDPQNGSCGAGAAPPGSECDDGEPCTTLDICEGQECVGSGPDPCGSAANPCIPLECELGTGSCLPKALPDGAPCDAKNLCTDIGTCSGGECDSKTVVTCLPSEENCKLNLCHPSTGECSSEIAPDGTACEDGDLCTVGASCLGSQCQTGSPLSCPDDGQSCTIELCLPGVGCEAVLLVSGTPCEDGDPCTSESQCEQSNCVSGENVTCPSDGDPCTSDLCVEGEGCLYLPVAAGSACDDGSACTQDDKCQGGTCVGTAKACSASEKACVVNLCNAGNGECEEQPEPVTTVCNDGNFCTVSDHCDGVGQCTGNAKVCAQGEDPCYVSKCDAGLGGCVSVPAIAGTKCEDGLLCTVNDQCDGSGGCGGSAPNCPTPETPCFEAGCNSDTGECTVVVSPNGSPCDAVTPCLVGDFCLGGECQTGATPKCLAQNDCYLAFCDQNTNACTEEQRPDGSDCNDLDACTSATICSQGACQGGEAAVCKDDGNSCTAEACNSETGLCESTQKEDGANCSDSDSCTVQDSCDNGQCSGLKVECGPAVAPCDLLQCNSVSGLCEVVSAPEGASCDDADVCTAGEQCFAGQCVGQPTTCPDLGIDCQLSLCQAAEGCVLQSSGDGLPCDSNPCFENTVCVQGQC